MFERNTTIKNLAAREIALSAEKIGLTVSLKAAEKTAGETLADGAAEKEIAAMVSLNTRIAALDLGIATLRSRRPAAIMARFAEQAGAVREEVAERQKQLAGIQVKTGKLLAELSRIEGVNYSEDILSLQTSSPGGMYVAAKSDLLRSEIQTANAKADSLEAATVPAFGFIDLEDVTDDQTVVAAVLQHPSFSPTAEVIGKWLVACADDNRAPGRTFGASPRRVRVEWNAGVIDTNASYVFVSGLARKRTGVMNSIGMINPASSPTLIDVKSGEFRAAA